MLTGEKGKEWMTRQRRAREASLVVSVVVSCALFKSYITPLENVCRRLTRTQMSYHKHNTSYHRATRRIRNRQSPVTLVCFSKAENTPHHYVYKANKPIPIVHVYSVTSHPAWPSNDQMSLYNEKPTHWDWDGKSTLVPSEPRVWGSNRISQCLPRSKQGRVPMP